EHFSDYAHIKTKTRMSCLEIQQALWQLENEGVVLYANPYLYYFIPNYNGGAGFVLPDPLMFGEGVIVNLADDASDNDLRALALQTKTRIVRRNNNGLYLLAADKFSVGNAVEVAYHLNQQPKVKSADINFLFSLP
ncbi:MAG: hypothetical protein LPK19_12385, partial [Hymenobacteraceae bacterium]|nr:hypothetical protein [Hymenobacteraceae bacterium]MDX5397021.1 hypothetical protein [Hymenobacteraceae bacterium]MDX5513095.1 hypothetical protein [Hymenobacteraceae bacterium]